MTERKIPFDFILDYLQPVEVKIRPMFGMFAIYLDKRIMMVLRERKEEPASNGVWLATSSEYHKSLKKDLPSLKPITLLTKGGRETEWQLIPADANDFESSVIKACEFIIRGDPRIGKIPGI
jgi:hypothetical protein